VVEEEAYPLELVRYLHLNPVRAKVLPDLRALDRYPWTGHSGLLGTIPRPWQETAMILAQFGLPGGGARSRKGRGVGPSPHKVTEVAASPGSAPLTCPVPFGRSRLSGSAAEAGSLPVEFIA
jgi:hypothetical protein